MRLSNVAWSMGFCLLILAGCGSRVMEREIDYSQTPVDQLIMVLAGNGDLDNLEKLLTAQPELVGVTDPSRKTALHFAAANGQDAAVDFLLTKGANAQAMDEGNNTAADAALAMGFSDLSQKLRAAEQSAPQ